MAVRRGQIDQPSFARHQNAPAAGQRELIDKFAHAAADFSGRLFQRRQPFILTSPSASLHSSATTWRSTANVHLRLPNIPILEHIRSKRNGTRPVGAVGDAAAADRRERGNERGDAKGAGPFLSGF